MWEFNFKHPCIRPTLRGVCLSEWSEEPEQRPSMNQLYREEGGLDWVDRPLQGCVYKSVCGCTSMLMYVSVYL